jgi:hypothetical protein
MTLKSHFMELCPLDAMPSHAFRCRVDGDVSSRLRLFCKKQPSRMSQVGTLLPLVCLLLSIGTAGSLVRRFGAPHSPGFGCRVELKIAPVSFQGIRPRAEDEAVLADGGDWPLAKIPSVGCATPLLQ